MNERPEFIPTIVGQALHWFDKMKIEYRYIPELQLWEFIYEGLFMSLMNACDDNELRFYAPMLITDSDDEKTQKMIYDHSISFF